MEALIGLVVLTIALTSAIQLSIHLSQLTERNRNLNAAVALAEAKLEQLRNADFASVVTGAEAGDLDETGQAGETFTRSWVVEDDVPVAGLKFVTIHVDWTQVGGAQTYELSGVIEP